MSTTMNDLISSAYKKSLSEIRREKDFWGKLNIAYNDGVDTNGLPADVSGEFTIKSSENAFVNGEKMVPLWAASPVFLEKTKTLRNGAIYNYSTGEITQIPDGITSSQMREMYEEVDSIGEATSSSPMNYELLSRSYLELSDLSVGESVKVVKTENAKGRFMWDGDNNIQRRKGRITSISGGKIYVDSKQVPFFAVKKIEVPVIDSEIGTIRILSDEVEMGILPPITHEEFIDLHKKVSELC